MAKTNMMSGTSPDMLDPAKFKIGMTSMRKLFASKGIKSKADAYQLINQGFSEKRFNEADLRGMQHAADLVFDPDSFKLAQTLMSAKDKGLKIAAEKRAAKVAPTTSTKNQVKARNRMKFGKAVR